MQLKGTYTFQAPRDAVWAALMDPTVLAQALPGGEQLERVGENEYRAAMNVRVGPVQGRFDGKVELTDIDAPESYRMKVNGSGPAGFVNGEGAIRLVGGEADTTVMSYEGDVQVGGRIASVGQRLIDSTAKSIIRQGLKVLDEQIQARLAPPPLPANEPVAPTPVEAADELAAAAQAPSPSPAPAPSPTPTPVQPASQAQPTSTAKFAAEVFKDVARDLASDYIPPQQQEKVFYVALGALGMLLFVILVRLVQRD
jgi:carbon monoxide dehydrogenase subunit G